VQKKELEQLIKKDLTTRQIADKLSCSQSTVKYWLKKYSLKTNYTQHNKGGQIQEIRLCVSKGKSPYLCKYCGETDSEKFVNMGYGRKSFSCCKKCHSKRTVKRYRDNKRKAVIYSGGKCKKCGYNKCLDALDFHHVDPSEKDINFRYFKARNFSKIKSELDKCILLCANCHREIHSVA